MNNQPKRLAILFFLFFLPFVSFGQSGLKEIESYIFNLDFIEIYNKLANVPKLAGNADGKNQAILSGIDLKIPLPNGTYITFYLLEASVLSDELAKEHSYIKTYKAFEKDGKSVGRITTFNSEIHAFFVTDFGNVIVQPTISTEGNYESLFEESDGVMERCDLEDTKDIKKGFRKSFGISGFSNGNILKTYRMAVVTTAEFFTNNGGNQPAAMAEVTSTVGALSTIYETEVGITFTLVGAKIYEDAATDPFDPSGSNKTTQSEIAFTALASSEPGTFGLGNYDIGHTLHYSGGGGGVATIGTVCSSTHSKSRGWSGVSHAYKATFYHEVGHQFTALHTFNSVSAGCNGNITPSSAFEPGSGSTMMSYYGSCSPDNISGGNAFSRSYFHTNSLESIISFSTSTATCFGSTVSGNTPPTVNANPSGNPIIIPKGTPFTLSGTGSDTERLIYTWEQYDLGESRGAADDVAGSTDSPIFRSFEPSENGNVRTFPELTAILSGSMPSNDEALPTVARTINMRLTARDNNATSGGTTSEDVAITVADSGPFLVTTGNTPTLWFQGDMKAITWDVNGTNTAPVNCSNVNILISTDGGINFSSLLVNTANDGLENIIVPSIVSSEVRIKVEAVNNVFFDINDQNISISDGSCNASSSTITPDNNVSYVEGSSNLNFDLAAYGDAISEFSGVLESTDSPSNLSYKDTNGNCSGPSNANYYDVYTFYVEQAGIYDFTLDGDFGLLMNLYSGSFNASSVCSNWLASSAEKKPSNGLVDLTSIISINLTVGIYQLTLSNFGNNYPSIPTLPATYTIDINQGTVYAQIPEAGSPYDYTYLAYDTGSGLIKKFDSQSDFRSLPIGDFKIYGLYFAGGTDLSTYLEGAYTNLQNDIINDVFCGELSSNSKDLTITGCPSIPDAPTVTDITIDSGETGTLTASGCSGTVNWFEEETNGSSIATENSFTSPVLTESTTYYASCTETCESTSRGSGTITVNAAPYCDASGLDCNYGDVINNVTISTLTEELLNQTSGCSSNGFTLYDSGLSLMQGQTYTLSVSKGVIYENALSVWLDFNGNGVFETDEKVWQVTANQIETQSEDIMVPESASLGSIRMRVRLEENSNELTPCYSPTTSLYGEVEDYILTIVEDEPVNPCESNVTLVNPDDNFASGTSLIQTSDVITGSNHVLGGNITYDAGNSVVLLPGFVVNPSAEDEAVFLAKIGGCE